MVVNIEKPMNKAKEINNITFVLKLISRKIANNNSVNIIRYARYLVIILLIVIFQYSAN